MWIFQVYSSRIGLYFHTNFVSYFHVGDGIVQREKEWRGESQDNDKADKFIRQHEPPVPPSLQRNIQEVCVAWLS